MVTLSARAFYASAGMCGDGVPAHSDHNDETPLHASACETAPNFTLVKDAP